MLTFHLPTVGGISVTELEGTGAPTAALKVASGMYICIFGMYICTCVSVCMFVCVRARERERQTERETERECVCLCVDVCVCVCRCVCVCVFPSKCI